VKGEGGEGGERGGRTLFQGVRGIDALGERSSYSGEGKRMYLVSVWRINPEAATCKTNV